MTAKLYPAISTRDRLSAWIEKYLQPQIPLDASLKGIFKNKNANQTKKKKNNTEIHLCGKKKSQKAPAESGLASHLSPRALHQIPV